MSGGRSFYEIFLDLLNGHRGKVIGIILGLLAGLLIIFLGLWKAVFIVICVLIGYFAGKGFDDGSSLNALWKRLFGEC